MVRKTTGRKRLGYLSQEHWQHLGRCVDGTVVHDQGRRRVIKGTILKMDLMILERGIAIFGANSATLRSAFHDVVVYLVRAKQPKSLSDISDYLFTGPDSGLVIVCQDARVQPELWTRYLARGPFDASLRLRERVNLRKIKTRGVTGAALGGMRGPVWASRLRVL